MPEHLGAMPVKAFLFCLTIGSGGGWLLNDKGEEGVVTGTVFSYNESFFMSESETDIPQVLLEIINAEGSPKDLRALDIHAFEGASKQKRLSAWENIVFAESLNGSFQLVLTPEFDGVFQESEGQLRLFAPGQAGFSFPDAIALGVPNWSQAIKTHVGNQSGKVDGNSRSYAYSGTSDLYCQVKHGFEGDGWTAKFFTRTGSLSAIFSRVRLAENEWLVLEAGFSNEKLAHVFLRHVRREPGTGEAALAELIDRASERYSAGLYVLDTRIAGGYFSWAPSWEVNECSISSYF